MKKKQTISQKINYWLGIIIIGLLVGFSLQFARAWVEGTSPSENNVGAPLNTSIVSQFKQGALGFGGILHVYNEAYFDGNVGVGITNPQAKLDVVGGINFGGNSGQKYCSIGCACSDDPNQSPWNHVSNSWANMIMVPNSWGKNDCNNFREQFAGKNTGCKTENNCYSVAIPVCVFSEGNEKISVGTGIYYLPDKADRDWWKAPDRNCGW